MRRRYLAAAALAALFHFFGGAGMAAAGCHATSEGCEAGGGRYHIELPQTGGAPAPVVVFLHGYGGSAAQVLANRAMIGALTRRGYAVIAPQGRRRGGGGGPRSWSFGPFSEGRDEAAFLSAVLADAADRFGTSRERTVLAGFSAGAFMVHFLACADPSAFAAYAPVAGAFWRPQPGSCAGPVRMLHTHGWQDTVVPLEGRPLGGGRWQQGDVFAALELWRQVNGCVSHAPERSWSQDGLLRRRWGCGPGSDLELLLFTGGHSVPEGWAGWMADWFEKLPAR